MPLTSNDKETLLSMANNAIKHHLGLETETAFPINIEDFSIDLQSNGASFVTLTKNNELRGCIGSLEAYQPLIEDVTNNAQAAAFSDPRFAPVSLAELKDIHIQVSVLTKPEAIEFSSEADLLQQLRPNIDGLIIEEQGRRGTFLPTVWESLTTPEQFLQHLKLKANLPANYWSDSIKVYRYTTECF